MYARPMTPFRVGDVSAAGVFRFFRIRKFPARLRDISISVGTDFDVSVTDYFILDIVRFDSNDVIEWSSPRLRLDSDGLKAYAWKELVDATEMRSNVTYGLRVAVGAGTPSLSDLTVAFTIEMKLDQE